MFAFVSDTHLARQAWRNPKLSGDSYKALNDVADKVIARGIKVLILGGDIFDGQPEATDVLAFCKTMQRLKENDVNAYAIQGQHGRDRLVSWTTAVHQSVMDIHGLRLLLHPVKPTTGMGFDNMPASELEPLIRAMPPDIDVLFLHQMCRGALPERGEGQIPCWDFDPEWTHPTVKLILMGDLHNNYERTLEREVGGVKFTTRIVYNGSTCLQSVDEPWQKSFLVVNDDLSYERVPIISRPLHRLTINKVEDLDSLIAQFKANPPRGDILVLYFNTNVPGVEARVTEAVPDACVMLRPVTLGSEKTVEHAKEFSTISREQCLGQLVNQHTDGELYSFLTDVLKASNVRDCVELWRGRVLGDANADQKRASS